MSVLRNTDLPVPDGPSIALTSPIGSVSVTSCQIVWDPNRLVTPSVLTSTPMLAPHPSVLPCQYSPSSSVWYGSLYSV